MAETKTATAERRTKNLMAAAGAGWLAADLTVRIGCFYTAGRLGRPDLYHAKPEWPANGSTPTTMVGRLPL